MGLSCALIRFSKSSPIIILSHRLFLCVRAPLLLDLNLVVTAFTSWVQIMMGRFISGWGVGGLSAAVPVYQAESVPKQVRGACTSTYQLAITLGSKSASGRGLHLLWQQRGGEVRLMCMCVTTVLLAYAFSIGTRNLDNSGSWRIVIALGLVFCLILGVGIFFVPESPRWLIEKGRTEEARRGMARVRGLDENHPLVNSDFDEQWAAHELDKRAGTGSWAQCFLGEGKEVHNKAPYRTMVMIVMMAFQQLTGANVSPRLFAGVERGFRSWADIVRVNVCA